MCNLTRHLTDMSLSRRFFMVQKGDCADASKYTKSHKKTNEC